MESPLKFVTIRKKKENVFREMIIQKRGIVYDNTVGSLLRSCNRSYSGRDYLGGILRAFCKVRGNGEK